MSGNLCKAHHPIQHRDGKPPWCNECGLTSGYQEPVLRFGKAEMADNIAGIPFSTEEEGFDFPLRARELACEQARTLGVNITPQDVYVVWFAFILGNFKAICSTPEPDGRMYEVTYNAQKKEAYVDTYVKTNNILVHVGELS